MVDDFKIYLDRLKNGNSQKVEGIYSPNLIDAEDDELRFTKPVHVSAECYLAEDQLIISISAKTEIETPCSICNEWTTIPLSVEKYLVTEFLEEISGSTYPFEQALREALLLQVPYTAECNQGQCPARKTYHLGE
jgi:hypothetical protein